MNTVAQRLIDRVNFLAEQNTEEAHQELKEMLSEILSAIQQKEDQQ